MNLLHSLKKINKWFAGLSSGRKIIALFLYLNILFTLIVLSSGQFGLFLYSLIFQVILFPILAINPYTILLGIYDALMTAGEEKEIKEVNEFDQVIEVKDNTPIKLIESSKPKNSYPKTKEKTLKSKLKELKKLQEEGLISEEDYKKLKEKNLGL